MEETKSAPVPALYSTRVLLVVFGMIQITLAAGLIVGWPSIAGTMLVEPLESGGAGLSLDQTTQLYSLAAAVNYIAPLFLGLVLDYYGPRACSFLSNAIVAAGLAIFSMASSFPIYALGICLVAFGGPSVQQCLLHIGNMFAERRFFVMGMVAESITLSFAVFPLMDIAWENLPDGKGFRILFAGLSALVVVSAICSLLLWPDAPYEVPNEKEPAGEDEPLVKKPTAEANKDALKNGTFKEQVTSGVYIRLCIFFIVTSWWANFYIATVTTELGDQGIFGPEGQHSLTRWLSFLDAGAIVAAPLSGYLLDSVGFAPTAIITIALGVTQQVCLLIAGGNFVIMIFSFGTYAIYRAFLFPYFFATLSRKMGFRYFGFLSGISFCVSGLTQFTVAPVALVVEGDCHQIEGYVHIEGGVCEEGSWTAIHLVQIAFLLLLLLVPFFDIRSEQKDPKPITHHESTLSAFSKETIALSSRSIDYGAIQEEEP
ncbi:Major Facilitator Superfamily [Seminavis robusta]|uniref:Major Facilitator Superfamily n=1 Tax=Seminavis robusta TaxID=568900 RepID=A0A9N8E246_9STRA|nr:Major Facilitator Superfamily [Seminavis robusta]|eukprot:Sro575_g169430.1 Major Facilitator Superfamily (485) ;mRNA; f:55636-57191